MSRRSLSARATSWIVALLWAWTIAAVRPIDRSASGERIRDDVVAFAPASAAVRTTFHADDRAPRSRVSSGGSPWPVVAVDAQLALPACSHDLAPTSVEPSASPRRRVLRYDATAPPTHL